MRILGLLRYVKFAGKKIILSGVSNILIETTPAVLHSSGNGTQ